MVVRALRNVRSRAIPLDRADVDTDQIIPARHLKRIERTGFGQFAFELWRRDPNFVLNDPVYENAQILIAGPNFGCGSSREHAPWALEDLGLRVIVSAGFADIFRNNCANIGVLTVVLPSERLDALMKVAKQTPEAEWSVDVEQQTITAPGPIVERFAIDPFIKENLLEGRDKIALTLRNEARITAYEARRAAYLPRTVIGSTP